MNPKISVIVPIYNCEKYLDEAIQSLLNQSIKDCEFILVNDGSKDNSLNIANKYRKIDKRIKVISQPNQGVSIARNSGISVATGEYIGFIDADDWIESDMYETLYKVARENKLDLIISNFEQELDGKKIINKLDISLSTLIKKKEIIQDVLPQFLEHEKLNTVCNKLYKRAIINDNNIAFPKGVVLGEDGTFNINFFSKSKTLMYIDYSGYHYREVQGSATRNKFEKDYFKRALEVYKEDVPKVYYDNFTKEYIEEKKVKKLINNVISYTYIYLKSQDGIKVKKGYRYVKSMISNKELKSVLNKHFDLVKKDKGRYEKMLLRLIRRKSTLGIYLLTSYSRVRSS